jgi:uncharacterized membrane protein
MMRAALGALLAVVCVALSAAVQPLPSVPVAGFARYEHNKWLFRACTGAGASSKLAGEALVFIDATPGRLLFAAIQERWRQSADPLRGVYLEFAGYEENARVTATRLHRVLGWVDSCAARPANIGPKVTLWAAGNEPSWSFSMQGSTAAFKTIEQARSLPAATRALGETTIVEVNQPGARLRLELVPGLCSDTMSEAAFGYRATLAFNGALYTGCGLQR